MTYKLNAEFAKITSPVILVIEDTEKEYENGTAAYADSFEKYYLVDVMYVRDGKVVVVLKENDHINDTSWCGEEQVSFF